MPILITILLFSLTLYPNENYGWDIPNSTINIGGYLDMTYDQKREEKFLFDDIAMIFSANKKRFDLLGELELSHISLDGKSNSSSDVDLKIERLQLTYALDDEKSVQIGRFNSDIGYWNQAPINILEDTTTQPYMVQNFFPKATTGLLYHQDINENQSFSITLQDNKDISHQDNAIEVNRHYALAYHGVKDDFSWRISAGKYRQSNGVKAEYMGVGTEYDGEEFLIQAELFSQNSEEEIEEKPYSAYLQSTWHFKEKQDAVIRLESYKDNKITTQEEIYLLGYTYRPLNNMVIKGEYIHHSKLPLNRFVYSLSVLF